MASAQDVKLNLEQLGLDIDGLGKGDVFTADQLEAMTGQRRGTEGYDLAVLGLRKKLHTTLRDRGKPATVAIVRGELRILEDTEASVYNAQAFRHGIRKARRAFDRLLEVDSRQVTPERLAGHGRAIEVNAKILSAINSTRAKCRRTPIPVASGGHARQTPAVMPQRPHFSGVLSLPIHRAS